ncbi:hypothetical protein CC2G_011106 [Coprinopsis cinerea AmutBmut pab1-1]|nr:hypothetical protein CC2G_011106 [Coprinopsis cinerea AmutBmut pab1-1]
MDKVDGPIPYKKYIKLVNDLDRRAASWLVQIRTGHIPLNDYLFKRRLTDSPTCPNCNLHASETITHVLRDCPAYRTQRTTLHKELWRRDWGDPIKAIRYPAKAKAILTFLATTGRLEKQDKHRTS